MDRLLQILDDWKLYMRSDNHKLGYPSKSLGMSSGGESTEDEFTGRFSDEEDVESTRDDFDPENPIFEVDDDYDDDKDYIERHEDDFGDDDYFDTDKDGFIRILSKEDNKPINGRTYFKIED